MLGSKSIYDLAGGLGDVGVLIPLCLALATMNGFSLSGMLLAAGLFYISSAFFFKIPMPVQPLKAMAAIALAMGLTQQTVQVAGLMFGIVILLLMIPAVSSLLERLFPLPVIRGIQLALGVILIKTGMTMAFGDVPMALLAAAVLLVTYMLVKPLPPIIPLLIIGGAITFFGSQPASSEKAISLTSIFQGDLSLRGILFPLTALVIPQLGLTIGNSIMATVQTAKDLYPGESGRVTVKSLALSIGLGNLVSPFLGGIPMCHGSGGLTAHHRFGARTKAATMFAGALFLVAALIPSRYTHSLLLNFPRPFLGVPLIIVGVFHAMLSKEIIVRGRHATAVLTCALVSVFTRNLTIGVVAGFAAFKVEESLLIYLEKRRALRKT